MLFKVIAGFIKLIGGIIFIIGSRSNRYKVPKWSSSAIMLAGLSALISGILSLILAFRGSYLDANIFRLIISFRTFTGGFCVGVLVVLFIAGQLKLSKGEISKSEEHQKF
jgi:hypothetical protein